LRRRSRGILSTGCLLLQGWFDSKVKQMEALVKPKAKPMAASKPAAPAPARNPVYASSGGINWGAVGKGGKGAVAKPKNKPTNSFAALMGDDDDDDSD
jgi:hypothetical protein